MLHSKKILILGFLTVCFNTHVFAMVETHVEKYTPREKFRQVCNAAILGDIKKVEDYFDATPKPDINAQDDNGWTLLMFATNANQGQVVDKLLELGINFNMQNQWGGTALMIAARKGNEDIIRKLLRANARKNITDSMGRTVQHVAKNAKILELLVVGEDKVEEKEVEDKEFEEEYRVMGRGIRKLMFAANRGHHGYVQRLCAEHKADGTINEVINEIFGQSLFDLKTPVEWAIVGLNKRLDPEVARFYSPRKDSKGKSVEPFDDYLLTIKTLIEFGAVVGAPSDKEDEPATNVSQELLTEIVAGIDADGKINRDKIWPAIERIQGLANVTRRIF